MLCRKENIRLFYLYPLIFFCLPIETCNMIRKHLRLLCGSYAAGGEGVFIFNQSSINTW